MTLKTKKRFNHGRIIYRNQRRYRQDGVRHQWLVEGVVIEPAILESIRTSAVMEVIPEYFEIGCPHSTVDGYCLHETDGSVGWCDFLDHTQPDEGASCRAQNVCKCPEIMKMFAGLGK